LAGVEWPGAALVQQQDPELLERAAEPGALADETVRSEAGAALEVDQPGEVLVRLVPGDDLPGEELDRLPRGVRVVERHGEASVGEDDAGLAVADGQRCSRYGGFFGPRPSSAHVRPAAEPWDHEIVLNDGSAGGERGPADD
jgi:hypothetical protein